MAQMIGEACKGSVKEGRLSQCPLDHSPDRRVAMERAPCRRTLFVTVVRVDYTDYMTFAAISLISDLSFEPL
jgi:hypothetical protein